MISGVPQGTVLGPLLFLILLTSIDTDVDSFISSFADDTKLQRSVKSYDDVHLLQRDLDRVYEWASTFNMEFNSDKFQLLRYGANEKLKSETSYKDPSGGVIAETSCAKDLGVIMSSDGRFTDHINLTVQKASNMSGWIFRTFYTRQAKPLLTLYKALVLSKLDYCCPLWNPENSAYLCSKIENVQRSFTRKIENMRDLDYWSRLKILNLYSVQRRRERYIILYIFKIVHNLVPNCGITFRSNPRTGIHVEVPKLDRNKSALALRMQENAFTYVGPKLYNAIPCRIRRLYDTIDPVGTFKTQLDAFLNIVPDEPTIHGKPRRASSNSLIHQIAYCDKQNY